MFRHPKYYKELRKRNRELRASTALPSVPQSDQVISLRAHDGECERAPGQGLKQQASSVKLQASSVKLSNQPEQATSDKRQAPGSKRQASSHKLQAP